MRAVRRTWSSRNHALSRRTGFALGVLVTVQFRMSYQSWMLACFPHPSSLRLSKPHPMIAFTSPRKHLRSLSAFCSRGRAEGVRTVGRARGRTVGRASGAHSRKNARAVVGAGTIV